MRAEEDAGLRIDTEGRGEGDRGAVDMIQSDLLQNRGDVEFTCEVRDLSPEVSK